MGHAREAREDRNEAGRREGEVLAGGDWRKCESSGQSVREFCQERGLKENQFYSWRRELKLRDAEAQRAARIRGTGAGRRCERSGGGEHPDR